MQVFYYLGELNDSLSYALGAGPLFDVSEDSDYVHTLLGMTIFHVVLLSSLLYSVFIFLTKLLYENAARAIDEYASLKSKTAESKEVLYIDPRLEAIVERMLDKYVYCNFYFS